MTLELPEINNSEDIIRNILTRSTKSDLEDLKTYFYIAVGIYGFLVVVLIGLVIGLYVWVNKITTTASEDEEDPRYRNDDLMREREYKITRPKIHNDNPFKRFTLPNKPENDINSDVYYGGGGSKNPLSQPSALHRSKSFADNNMKDFEGGRSNRTGDSNPVSPTSGMPDYYSFNDRNKFAY